MAYELLVLLAISDRLYHKKEMENIKSFLDIHFDAILDEDVSKTHKKIIRLTTEERLNRLIEIAEYFKEDENLDSKISMIEYALELIIADHKVTDEERLRFKILGEYWNMDLQKFIDQKLKK